MKAVHFSVTRVLQTWLVKGLTDEQLAKAIWKPPMGPCSLPHLRYGLRWGSDVNAFNPLTSHYATIDFVSLMKVFQETEEAIQVDPDWNGWGPIYVNNRAAIKVEVTDEKRVIWMTKETASGHGTPSLPMMRSIFCPQMIKLNINWSSIHPAKFSVSPCDELICSPGLCWRNSSNTGDTSSAAYHLHLAITVRV